MKKDTLSRLTEKLRQRAPFSLSADARLLASDADLTPDVPPRHKKRATPRAASVLVPFIEREEGFSVLLTTRTQHLPDHAGEVSLPGGGREAHDEDAIATALRETEEEVGIARTHIDVLGQLPHYQTGTGFLVTPVLGVIKAPYDMAADPHEVDEVFEVPLAHVMEKRNRQKLTRRFGDHDYQFYAMPYGDYYIWGVTAALFVNLRRALMFYATDGRENS